MSYYGLDARFVPVETWPGKRTVSRTLGRFKTTTSRTIALLKRELQHLGARNIVVQLECDASQIRLDGYPRADARVRGPGVIVSFETRHGPLSFPCDTFQHWDDNLRAIALSLENLRAVDRYGVTKTGEQYRGWSKLPPAGGTSSTMTAEAAAEVFRRMGGGDVSEILVSRAEANEVYRRAVKAAHPDAGGSTGDFQLLQEARHALDRHFGGARS